MCNENMNHIAGKNITTRHAVMSATASVAQKLKLSDEDLEELKTLSQAVLAVVVAVGATGLLILAPNMMKVLNLFIRKRYPDRKWSHREKQEKIIKTLYYLKSSGYIQMEKNAGEMMIISALPKGLKRIIKLVYKPKILEPKSWSGTWWVVAGDIPMSHRINAIYLRKRLLELGFYSLQRTLWIHPYDPREVLASLLKELDVGQFVTLMEVVNIDVDDRDKLLRHFKL